jgi:hypothetical protein
MIEHDKRYKCIRLGFSGLGFSGLGFSGLGFSGLGFSRHNQLLYLAKGIHIIHYLFNFFNTYGAYNHHKKIE